MVKVPEKAFNVEKDIPDQTGKVILITGGNGGIGREVCLALAKHSPSKIYIAARNQNSTQIVINEIHSISPQTKVTFLPCDLSSFASVKTAAETFLATETRLDLLFCNSGILGAPPSVTVDGYELNFAVNHLGHALLVKLLLPTLLATTKLQTDVRVISTGSDGYRMHTSEGVIFKDLRTPQKNLTMLGLFGGWLRYFQSKLANILYTVELARRYPTLTFITVHPGIVDTDLTPSFIKSTAIGRQVFAGGKLITPEQGAWNLLWAATAKGVVNGEYYEPVGVVGKRTPKSKNMKLAGELWLWTEEQLGGFLA